MKKIILLGLALLGIQAANAQYPLVPIDSVQFINPTKLAQVQYNVAGQDNTLPDYIDPVMKNPTYGDTVVIEGVVLFDPSSYGLSANREATWLQRPGGDEWSAVQVMYDSGAVPVNQNVVLFKQNMKKGRTVRVTGVIRHFQGETQLTVINVPTQVISLGPTTISPTVLTVEDFIIGATPQFVTGEPYEGVYVELQNVICYNPAPGAGPRYTWSVQDANGNRLPVRDISGYFRNDNNDEDPTTPVSFAPPANGAIIPYIRGIISEQGNGSFKTYYIAPLYPNDVAAPIEPPAIANLYRTPAQATSLTPVKIRAEITDQGSVASAVLHYAVGYPTMVFTPVIMTNIGGDWYEGTVPAQANGTIVKYYIKATDNNGFSVNYPDSLALNSAYKVIDGTITSIVPLQETVFPNGASMFAYDTLTNLNIRAKVISGVAGHDLGLVAIQSDFGPWGTIFVRFTTGDSIVYWKRGDSVLIKRAVVTERIPLSSAPFGRTSVTGMTHIEDIGLNGWEYISRCNDDALPAVTLPFDSLMSPTFNKEPYENVLVELNNVWVVQKNADSITGQTFGEFAVNPNVNATVGFRADDYSNDLFTNRVSDSLNQNGLDFLPVFRGILVSTFGNWKFLPRNRTDMSKAGNVIPPTTTRFGPDTLFVLRGTAINDPGAEVCDDEQGTSIPAVVDSSGVDINVAGTYEMFYNATDQAGNEAQELNRYVVVTPGVGITLPEAVEWKLYPVPAGNSLHVDLRTEGTETWTLKIFDVSGRLVYESQVNANSTERINTSSWKQGLYICQISSESVQLTEKISIVR